MSMKPDLYLHQPVISSAPSVPVTVIEDAFTDSNGVGLDDHTPAPTNTPGSAWVEAQYTWDIQSNRANSKQNINATHIAVIQSNISNGTISCILRIYAGTAAYRVAGLVFRYLDNNNLWIARLDANANTFTLYERDAGAWTQRASANYDYLTAVDYAVQVVLSGPDITASDDKGNSIAFSSALHQANTKHGMFADCYTTRFETFKATT